MTKTAAPTSKSFIKRSLWQRVKQFFTHHAEDGHLVFVEGEDVALLLANGSRLIEEQYAVMQAQKALVFIEAAMCTLQNYGGMPNLTLHQHELLDVEQGYLLRTLQNQHSPIALMKSFCFIHHHLELGVHTYSLDKKRRQPLETLVMPAKDLANIADAILTLCENKLIYADHMDVKGATHGEMLHRATTGEARRMQPDQLNKLGNDILHAASQAMRMGNEDDVLKAEQQFEHSARWLVGLVQRENHQAGPMLVRMNREKVTALMEKNLHMVQGSSRYKH